MPFATYPGPSRRPSRMRASAESRRRERAWRPPSCSRRDALLCRHSPHACATFKSHRNVLRWTQRAAAQRAPTVLHLDLLHGGAAARARLSCVLIASRRRAGARRARMAGGAAAAVHAAQRVAAALVPRSLLANSPPAQPSSSREQLPGGCSGRTNERLAAGADAAESRSECGLSLPALCAGSAGGRRDALRARTSRQRHNEPPRRRAS